MLMRRGLRPSASGRVIKTILHSPRNKISSNFLQSHSQKFSTFRRLHNTQDTYVAGPPKRSLFRRALSVTAIGIISAFLGVVTASAQAIGMANEILNHPTDEETLILYKPEDDIASEIEDHIKNHPVAVELRSKSEFRESRPHLKMPASYRAQNLTGGTLMGPGRIVVPPYTWNEEGGKSLVSISYLGGDLCGHPGIIHGGLLATILDEGLARCCFPALPNKVGVTANLNINYRAPAMAGSFVVLRATTTKVEGRKAWVEGRIETLVGEGETPVVLADASALFIEPRQAEKMKRLVPE